MALVNRDKDGTEQVAIFAAVLNSTPSGVSAGILNPGLSTGTTFRICTIPYPSKLIAAETAVWGLSGAPTHNLWIYRFAGGFTSMLVGATLAPTAFGTSGALGFSIIGGVSWPLLAGDQIVLYTTGSNTAVAEANVSVAIQALQDIKTSWGVSP